MLKRTLLYVVVMLILLALAVSAGQWDKNTALLQQHANQISAWLDQQESILPEGAGTTLVHRGDSLLQVSNTQTIPGKFQLRQLSQQNGRLLWHLPQGWYVAIVSPKDGSTQTTLIPIQFEWNTQVNGNYQAFPADRTISGNARLSATPTDYVIRSGGKDIAWLEAAGTVQSAWLQWFKLTAWLLFFGVLLAVISQLAAELEKRFGWFAGSAFVTTFAAGLIVFNLYSHFTAQHFGALPLFQSHFAASSWIGASVGDWLLHALLLLFAMAYFHRSSQAMVSYQNDSVATEESSKVNAVRISFASYFAVMAALLLITEAIRALVLQSKLNLDFDHVLNLGALGFTALTGLIALSAGVFFFGHRMALGVSKAQLPPKERLIGMGAAAVLFGICATLALPSGSPTLWVILFGLIYVFTMDRFVHWQGGGFGWAILWLVLYAMFASTQLYHFSGLKDQNTRFSYARALANDRDTAFTEVLLPRVAQAFRNDSATIGRLLKPWPFKAGAAELRDYLNQAVFAENYLFQQYQLKAFAFDKDNQPILQGQTLSYEQVVLGNWATAKTVENHPDIRYETDADGAFRYILQLNFHRMGDQAQPATLYLFFDRTHPVAGRVFKQLFFDGAFKDMSELRRFDFSVTKNGKLTIDQGLVNRSVLGAGLKNDEVQEFGEQGRVDAVAKSADGQTIAAVGHAAGGWLKQVFLFSILFSLAALCLFAVAAANTILKFLPYNFRLSPQGSLAKRIHFWNITLLAISFLVVGYLTYRHFTNAARDAERNEFNFKANALMSNLKSQALKSFISEDSLHQALPTSLATMANSMGMDAQWYDASGKLLFSTQEELVQLGVLPSMMNPAALSGLRKNQQSETVENESSAGKTYQTYYRAVQNARGKVVGYLGVPYRENAGTAVADVSDFIGMLASLYVFLLLLAFGVTYLLARSITQPVRLLSEKVQVLRLEDKNEPLAYSGDSEDEISQLIGEYNSMVEKLEASKVKLVKLERESAWREMARQVAHDIKNPLTTMKLSMQQLERLSGSPEQAAAYLRKAITRLIEQIDSLAQIASEFSMFANLDIKSKNDVIINEVVESVHDLFSEQKHVDLTLSLPEERYHILGDKNHLIRVFNNLVINAIQAIPSDRRGHIDVSLVRKGEVSEIKISDNGGGIPPEIRERVFEPNFTTKTSGSGLGLAICKKIIEAHDGNIRFETRDNEGTDFYVEIPVTAVG